MPVKRASEGSRNAALGPQRFRVRHDPFIVPGPAQIRSASHGPDLCLGHPAGTQLARLVLPEAEQHVAADRLEATTVWSGM